MAHKHPLTDRQRKRIRRLHSRGYNGKIIARSVGVHPSSVYTVLKTDREKEKKTYKTWVVKATGDRSDVQWINHNEFESLLSKELARRRRDGPSSFPRRHFEGPISNPELGSEETGSPLQHH